MLQFHLKTSQFGAGLDIVVGRTGNHLCPVSAVLHYIDSQGNHPGLFFTDNQCKAITKPQFITRLRVILEAIGLPQSQFAGHSFRIGATTLAVAVGVEDSTIQTLG